MVSIFQNFLLVVMLNYIILNEARIWIQNSSFYFTVLKLRIFIFSLKINKNLNKFLKKNLMNFCDSFLYKKAKLPLKIIK